MSHLISELAPQLERLNISPISVTRLEESSFGSKVYLLEMDREKNVLKLFYGSREYWRERKTLELLEPTALVPRVLDGIQSASGFDGALLLEYIENENLASSPVNSSTAFDTGVILARLHQHSLGTLGFFGAQGVESIPFEGWWSFRRHLLTAHWSEFVRRRLDSDFVQKCCDYIVQSSALFTDKEPTGLTHCDFRFGNVLKRRDGRLVTIDFESSREGDCTYDFIKIWEHLANPNDTSEWQSFLEGYASIRSLPENLAAKLTYYWFDLNFGYLYWSIDRGDERLFQQRLSIVKGLLDDTAFRC